jgi:hypothetical protein
MDTSHDPTGAARLRRGRRAAALGGLVLSLALLGPGLFLPVLSVRGTLQPEGLALLAPQLLEQGISEETVTALRPLLNPLAVAFLDAAPGGLRQGLLNRLGDQVTAQLAAGPEIEVYHQTRSILGAVSHLYAVGSPTAATLILLFSVVVPIGKTALVVWALFLDDLARRMRTLYLVEMIAKWSMADVFAVALFIAYLAAQASPTAPAANGGAAVVAFSASFGAGFYWFAAYCLVSLSVQQATARSIMAAPRARPV